MGRGQRVGCSAEARCSLMVQFAGAAGAESADGADGAVGCRRWIAANGSLAAVLLADLACCASSVGILWAFCGHFVVGLKAARWPGRAKAAALQSCC